MKKNKIISLYGIGLLTLLVAACNGGSGSSTASQSVLTAYPPQFATTKQQGVFSPSGDPQFDENNKYEIVTNTGNESEGYYLEVYGFKNAAESEVSSINGSKLKLFESNCLDADFKTARFNLSNCNGKLESSGYVLTADYSLRVQGRGGVHLAKGKFNLNVPRSDFIDEKTTKSDVAENMFSGGRNLQVAPARVENWEGEGTVNGRENKKWVFQSRVGSSPQLTHHFYICGRKIQAAGNLNLAQFNFYQNILFSATQDPYTLDSIAGMRKMYRIHAADEPDGSFNNYRVYYTFGDNLGSSHEKLYLNAPYGRRFPGNSDNDTYFVVDEALISRVPCGNNVQ